MTLSQQIVQTDYGQRWHSALLRPEAETDIELSDDPRTEFIGFTRIYKHLAAIVPRARTIIDLGCAYAPQAFYFRRHRAYIGVDVGNVPKLQTPNATYFRMSIAEFIENELPHFRQSEIFGICSYVPPWHHDNMRLVRENFQHCFVYYVERCDLGKLNRLRPAAATSRPDSQEG